MICNWRKMQRVARIKQEFIEILENGTKVLVDVDLKFNGKNEDFSHVLDKSTTISNIRL